MTVVGADVDVEAVNAALVRLKDAVWAVRRDRLRTARAVADLARPGAGAAAVEAYTSVQVALSALDRLEVRGRDSAGIHLLVQRATASTSTPPASAPLARAARPRPPVPLGRGAHARGPPELRLQGGGRDRRAGRQHRVICAGPSPTTSCSTWPSSSPTARGRGARPHPLGQRRHHLPAQRPPAQLRRGGPPGDPGPYVAAALNGDVDNFADLKASEALAHRRRDHHRRQGHPHPRSAGGWPRASTSPRPSGARWPRSTARSPSAPSRRRPPTSCCSPCGAAARRSTSAWPRTPSSSPASPTALVEETPTYLRMDGETPANPDNPTASRGQVVVLDARPGRHPRRHPPLAYDGTELPVEPSRARRGRDHHPRHRPRRLPALPPQGDHRGAGLVPQDAAGQARRRATARFDVRLGPETLPDDVAAGLADGAISRVIAIGQGTAAVAGQAGGGARRPGRRHRRCGSSAQLATELSGFGLRPDMSDTLVVAISQSGTTTDTNRTVDLVRGRGASGGRHRQPAQQRPHRQVRRRALHVRRARRGDERRRPPRPSTPRWPPGFLLAVAIADLVGARPARPPSIWLAELRDLPEAMAGVLAPGPTSPTVAHQLAPAKRYWAIVGNGRQPDRRPGAADQALRALLQVDRLRRHRGQEAHRPVVRAAHPRVRRRADRARTPTTWPRRWRSTGPTRRRRS